MAPSSSDRVRPSTAGRERDHPRRALVLTAGFGTRLRPLSFDRAKPAVPVAGEPLIRRILTWLVSRGVADAVLNLHYKPETIARVVGDGSDLGAHVRYSWENPILGSAGGPRRALPLLGAETFFIVNGDTLTNVDLEAMARAHRASGARVTLAVIPNPDPLRYGGVLLDAAGAVGGFTRRGSTEPALHFVGVQIASPDVFAGLPMGQRTETVNGLYPQLIEREPGSVRAFISDAAFVDVGTPQDYLAASLDLWRAGGSHARLHGDRVSIDPSARVIDTVIWDDVTIEPSCDLRRSVIGDGVRIPAGSRFAERAIVLARDRQPEAGEQIVGDLLIAPLGRHAAGLRPQERATDGH